jgi:hypothetical protein
MMKKQASAPILPSVCPPSLSANTRGLVWSLLVLAPVCVCICVHTGMLDEFLGSWNILSLGLLFNKETGHSKFFLKR